MARRLYDSGLIQQRWYIELKPKHKALYIHLLCCCDNAGVFEVNPIMMSAFIGEQITEADIYNAFGNRVYKLSESKGILSDFVYFQCGGEIKEGCRPHDAIVKRLGEVGLTVDELKTICTHDLKYTTMSSRARTAEPSVAEPVAPVAVVQKPKPRTETFNQMFSVFWSAYPRKDGKATSLAKFSVIMRDTKEEEREALLDRMLNAVCRQRASEQWSKDGGRFIPMPATWLNQRRWEDEGVSIEEERKQSAIPSAKVSSILGNVNLS